MGSCIAIIVTGLITWADSKELTVSRISNSKLTDHVAKIITLHAMKGWLREKAIFAAVPALTASAQFKRLDVSHSLDHVGNGFDGSVQSSIDALVDNLVNSLSTSLTPPRNHFMPSTFDENAALRKNAADEKPAKDPLGYDEWYDEMKEEEERKAEKARLKPGERPKPKHIHHMLKAAMQRKREDDYFYDRKKMRQSHEGAINGEAVTTFITGAYKKKLQEDGRWKEQRDRVEVEEIRSGQKRMSEGKMLNFEAINRNVRKIHTPQEEKDRSTRRVGPHH
eukprot:gnl/MRDRNA2_/MRDRNA2_27922_c0_seq1.p1 gnl/MRDRNA2_/MRDRNA2_27922_c0~~gnl/MRDRNA2_/MRDRNA2_27922_c0_seq1.p1  ORF type:complete len:280 (+),score=61.43 gnl/MRDRNA2_/MRDRNA2_27922_c0_seq1:120-959(+)